MSAKTIYTSTVTVPVYASWKCECCGQINFSVGTIAYRQQRSTGSLRTSKHEETKKCASYLAKTGWAEHAYRIMSNPNGNAMAMRDDLFLQHTNCTKCDKKPKWDKGTAYKVWTRISLMPAIVSGIVAFAMTTSIVAWLVFFSLLSIVVHGIITEPRYRKMMAMLPKEYTPVIGSLNAELIDYAKHVNASVPSPDECFAIVSNYAGNDLEPKEPIATEKTTFPSKEDNGKLPKFCRKCGTSIQNNRNFCHKCGTEILK